MDLQYRRYAHAIVFRKTVIGGRTMQILGLHWCSKKFDDVWGNMAATIHGDTVNEGSGYRYVVLAWLFLIYMLNYVDRALLSIVQEPLKAEFNLSDLQLGLLGGLAFAMLYAAAGLPIARLAERHSRVSIVSICCGVWSVMTAACGLATSYAALFLCRMGVSIGEAGCLPSSQSLISDYFRANRRTTALAIHSAAVPVANIFVAVVGGWVAQTYGWRTAFIVLGGPGLLVAVLTMVWLREPPRAAITETPNLRQALAQLWAKRTFRHLVVAFSIGNMVAFGVAQYLSSFLIRTHGLSIASAGQIVGLLFGTCAAVGTLGIGYLADRVSEKRPTAGLAVSAIALLVAVPALIAGYWSGSIQLAIPFFILGSLLHYNYAPPVYAVVAGIVHARMRATAVAVLSLVSGFCGYALGPPLVGFMSDALGRYLMAEQGLSASACRADEVVRGCAEASATGLQVAITIALLFYVWVAFHLWRARRTMIADWVG